MRTRLQSNSSAILAAMLERGYDVQRAAEVCNIDSKHFSLILKADKGVYIKTAIKLKKAFGDDVVTILPPAQVERK